MVMTATMNVIMNSISKFDTFLNTQCKDCFLRTYLRLFDKFNLSDSQRDDFIKFFHSTLEKDKHALGSEIQRELNRKLSLTLNINNLFADEKAKSNSMAQELYNDWKPRVFAAKNPFEVALKLSIAGNIMDYGASNNFDVNNSITRVMLAKFAIDHSKQLQNRIKEAKSILYIGDNAGEIVFDKLFIETINHPNVTYVVRGGAVLNDATLTDAKDTDMYSVAKVIDNGFDAPSTVLSKCSPEFINTYKSAELIIAKGQGNLEGLINEDDSRIFFLLMVKCDVIANLLNVAKGSFIVYNPN